MTNTTPLPPIDLWNELSLANSAALRASRHIAVAISDRHPALKAILDQLQEAGEALAGNCLAPAILGTDSYLMTRLVTALVVAATALLNAVEVIADAEGVNEHAQDALRAAARANRAVRCHFQARGLLRKDAGGDA